MPTKSTLLQRLNEIGQSLENSGKALALLGLGSVGNETDRLDEYSDLDFFVIVQSNQKQLFLESLWWLESVKSINYKVRNTVDGYKALMSDGIFCEFAVFEVHELEGIPFSEGRVIWQDKDFDANVCTPKNCPAEAEPHNIDWVLGEALTNLYVAICRFNRGEKLSAMRFCQSFALDRLIDLVNKTEKPQCESIDLFVADRRLEQRYPNFANLLPTFAQGYQNTPQSILAQLGFLETHFKVNSSMSSLIIDLCKTEPRTVNTN
ncbi:hypothetical protein QWZ04_07800 [Vibrio tapetis subsp. quintayensis]|uniref:hypothetical protein n=1 Tax=Vibrio tapetis TaxID=52443 RepID=UPI0025B4CE2A|nr:hypothetical protein [Vibrio tapetis]MDN3680227.1 hypothetical protein [Vibrio tapetis subsp. quintayensis]